MSGQLPKPELEELRIVLVGRTGNGMTSVMNKILGESAEPTVSASSQTTQCRREILEKDGQKLVIIDTPGVLNTKKSEEQVKKDIVDSISFAAPGPHVFLLVMKARAITEYDKTAVQIIQQIFGKESIKFTLALFTDTKKWQPTDEDIQGSILKGLIHQHHSLEKKNREEKEEVPELLKKINALVEKNNREHYTSDMLKQAQEAIDKMKKDTQCKSECDLIKILKKLGESSMNLVFGDKAEHILSCFECVKTLTDGVVKSKGW